MNTVCPRDVTDHATQSLCIDKAYLRQHCRTPFTPHYGLGLNGECEIEGRIFLCTSQRDAPENLIIKFAYDDDGPKKLFASTILLETNILTEVAVPDLTYVEEQSRVIRIIYFALDRGPYLVIFFHGTMVSRVGSSGDFFMRYQKNPTSLARSHFRISGRH